MGKYREYTDEQIIKAVQESKSIAEVLRKLSLIQAGGNYHNIQKNILRLNCDTSHFTGQHWNRGNQLKDWKDYKKNTHLKKNLIKKRGNKCEECKLEKWLDKDIKLELHHQDGNSNNNNEDNLKLLCPNCHSYTDTLRKRKDCSNGSLAELEDAFALRANG